MGLEDASIRNSDSAKDVSLNADKGDSKFEEKKKKEEKNSLIIRTLYF